ncbi:MAG: DUF1015 domain-containing protein [Candidatus Marinimicrobia bacterium]|nr:DUF1015 domain-containing protein [Candidatus Neomarinimicrobiota bacterium]
MAEIFPFKAIVYNPIGGRDVSSLVAPPYDVIDPGDRARLMARDQHNIARLVLPEPSGGLSKYENAARQYKSWKNNAVLSIDDNPALYVWEQRFKIAGQDYTRRALVAKVSAKPYAVGGVMRHEHTHAGPKADRLALFQATGAQFSQMFGIFPDQGGSVTELLLRASEGSAMIQANGDDGQRSRLFRINDRAAVARLRELLAPQTITMADGHHRYETTLAYYEQIGRDGTTLMALVPDSDPGLVVLPTHRVINLPEYPSVVANLTGSGFTVRQYDLDQWERQYREAEEDHQKRSVVAVSPSQNRTDVISWSADGKVDAIYRSSGDVGVLHAVILKTLARADDTSTPLDFTYIHEADAAVAEAGKQGACAFLLRPISVRLLLKLAERQEVMPAKSTYFFPKFLSGFVSAELD